MKQQIVFCVAIEYERDDAQSPNLEQHRADLERLVFDAVEKERQESMLSLSDLSANWITVDTLRVEPLDDSSTHVSDSEVTEEAAMLAILIRAWAGPGHEYLDAVPNPVKFVHTRL